MTRRTAPTDSERSLIASASAHESWGRTVDRAGRTATARAAFDRRFLEEAGGDPERAESLRRAYYKQLAARSVRARREAREGGGSS
jgi:hypothetical protein